jgi:hypothetical protein
MDEYVALSVRLLQRHKRRATSSCGGLDESSPKATASSSSSAAAAAAESRHTRLADGVAALLRLMWDEYTASEGEAALAGLVLSAGNA